MTLHIHCLHHHKHHQQQQHRHHHQQQHHHHYLGKVCDWICFLEILLLIIIADYNADLIYKLSLPCLLFKETLITFIESTSCSSVSFYVYVHIYSVN